MSELKFRIEAILFASGKGVSQSDLADYCDDKIKNVKKVLEELQEEYSKRETSLAITNTEDKWKLTVKGKYTNDIQKIVSETELAKPVLKTLAIIAYKSPVLQSDIIQMRGQGAYEHIKILAKEKLVTKDDEGRSYILKITEKFYNYFDVEGDEDIKEMFSKLRESHQKKLGELDVVDVEQEKNLTLQEQKKKDELGDLEIVDVEIATSVRTPEEISEENNFLEEMENKINQASQRINKEEMPIRHSHPELEKEQQTLDDTTLDIEEVKKSMNEEIQKDKEEKSNSLEEIEKYLKSQEEEKNTDKDDYL